MDIAKINYEFWNWQVRDMLDAIYEGQEFTDEEIKECVYMVDNDEHMWDEINIAINSVIESVIKERQVKI